MHEQNSCFFQFREEIFMNEKWYVVLKTLLKPWTKTLDNVVQYLIILSQNSNK